MDGRHLFFNQCLFVCVILGSCRRSGAFLRTYPWGTLPPSVDGQSDCGYANTLLRRDLDSVQLNCLCDTTTHRYVKKPVGSEGFKAEGESYHCCGQSANSVWPVPVPCTQGQHSLRLRDPFCNNNKQEDAGKSQL